jgi:hypothetical protein
MEAEEVNMVLKKLEFKNILCDFGVLACFNIEQ